MGRTKNQPQKREISLSTLGEFVPHIKKKKKKKKNNKNRACFLLNLASEYHQSYYVGDIKIGITNNVLPDPIKTCRLQFVTNYEDNNKTDIEACFKIVLEINENNIVVVDPLIDRIFLKELIQSNYTFSFELFVQNEEVFLKNFLTNIPLPRFNSIIARCMKTLFKIMYNVSLEEQNENAQDKMTSAYVDSNLKEIYDEILQRRYIEDSLKQKDIVSPFLKPTLRPYQKDAVQWMIYRETLAPNDVSSHIHPLYEEVYLKSGVLVFFNKYSGWIEKDPPPIMPSSKGGILADEMGLGKTVEVLACILSNPKSDFQKPCLDEEWDSEDENPLKVLLQCKTSKKRKQLKDKDYIDPSNKKQKKVDELMKAKDHKTKTKPAYKIALEQFYQKSLNEYCTTLAKKPPNYIKVQCICGSLSEKGTTECTVCGKYQHTICLGFKSRMGPYKCPQCWMEETPLETGATLIVAPASLHKQWCREVEQHLKSGIKVLKYEGFGSNTPVYPTELKTYDIVITTYTVLAAELKLTESVQSVNLRQQRKYWSGGSPLIRVNWWRLCLDEAQTVDTPGKIVSKMAQKIPAMHRWAITGTPISKGMSDIYGLIDYLQMSPFNDWDTWNYILYQPFLRSNKTPIYDFLGKVLWRTTKDSVINQINIPKQSINQYTLEFSAVEKFFYRKEHELTAKDFLQNARKFKSDLLLDKINKSDLKNLMGPLLSLRQACSDPSAVRGKGKYLALKKNVSSMKDLLDALLLKNKTDCEESLRLMISSINGLAGVYLLMHNYEQAITEYRKVLQIAASNERDNKENLSVDKLLLIHAMHNLADALALCPPIDSTLRDHTLRSDCVKLVQDYIEKFMKESASARNSWLSLKDKVTSLKHQFVLRDGEWYSDGFHWIAHMNLETNMLKRVEAAAGNANVILDFRQEGTSYKAMLKKTYTWRQKLEDKRDELLVAIEGLYSLGKDNDEPEPGVCVSNELVTEAMNCHLRPEKKTKKSKVTSCKLCLVNNKLKDYEGVLFWMKKRKYEDTSLEGNWNPNLEEIILKTLLSMIKSRNASKECISDGETDVQLLDVYKKEFKEIRKFWTQLDQQVCAYDEVDICKARLQLKTDDDISKSKKSKVLIKLSYEPILAHENIHLVKPEELDEYELTLRSDENLHLITLKELSGTRKYLTTLQSQQFEGGNPDPCPVCKCVMEKSWVILPCGHCYCLECFQRLIEKPPIRCSICRAAPNLQEVAYIKTGEPSYNSEDGQTDAVKVVGNYSRKLEAVIELLLKLRQEDPLVKVLLFSSWLVVLKSLRTALEKNNIRVELGENSGFEKKIENFKDPLKKVTVLLMPLYLGSKGLNLIEASHVILLEPVLNPADELQAIGRVHRIGQTKCTTVHKFLIQNTIEESLHSATCSDVAKWDKNKVTVGQLMELFGTGANSVVEIDEVECEQDEN